MSTPDWLDRAGWPYAPRFVALPEGRLHYVDEGTGDTVVLVHGTPTWSYEWRHVIAALRGAHRMVALDHLGFGLSDRPAGAGYAPEDHARRFRAAIAHLAPADPITLVVHDFGGPIALDWALDHARSPRACRGGQFMDVVVRRRPVDAAKGGDDPRRAGPLALPPAERVAAADHAIRLR